MVARVLVRWLGLPPSTVTYEDEAAFQHRYPSSLAWGPNPIHRPLRRGVRLRVARLPSSP
jgi:hypothetical protein